MAYSGSASARLARIQSAIEECLLSQEYSIRGRMVQRVRLQTLRDMEKELQREAGLEAQGQSASVGMIIRPS